MASSRREPRQSYQVHDTSQAAATPPHVPKAAATPPQVPKCETSAAQSKSISLDFLRYWYPGTCQHTRHTQQVFPRPHAASVRRGTRTSYRQPALVVLVRKGNCRSTIRIEEGLEPGHQGSQDAATLRFATMHRMGRCRRELQIEGRIETRPIKIKQ